MLNTIKVWSDSIVHMADMWCATRRCDVCGWLAPRCGNCHRDLAEGTATGERSEQRVCTCDWVGSFDLVCPWFANAQTLYTLGKATAGFRPR